MFGFLIMQDLIMSPSRTEITGPMKSAQASLVIIRRTEVASVALTRTKSFPENFFKTVTCVDRLQRCTADDLGGPFGVVIDQDSKHLAVATGHIPNGIIRLR